MPPRRRLAHTATVLRKEQLSPSLVRLVVGGGTLDRFVPSPCSDSYVKLVFLPAGVTLPAIEDGEDRGRVDLEAATGTLPLGERVRLRSYTVRAYDDATHELTLDLVVHGDQGLAGPWAASSEVGDEVLLMGPGGDYQPDPAAAWHLLAGDASALPAIAVALERLPADARGVAVVEVHDATEELELTAPGGVDVRWVHQGDGRPGTALVDGVLSLAWPADVPTTAVQAFAHGEAKAVRELRRHLRLERGMGLDRISASGYWRAGVDDEGWRATKREWNAEIERSEAVGVAG